MNRRGYTVEEAEQNLNAPTRRQSLGKGGGEDISRGLLHRLCTQAARSRSFGVGFQPGRGDTRRRSLGTEGGAAVLHGETECSTGSACSRRAFSPPRSFWSVRLSLAEDAAYLRDGRLRRGIADGRTGDGQSACAAGWTHSVDMRLDMLASNTRNSA